ncbi:MAG: hypothetical protein K2J10_00150 [Muribaculaceae bacterium]|nr:hypothetical protein [Muribaculaceae bacterium]
MKHFYLLTAALMVSIAGNAQLSQTENSVRHGYISHMPVKTANEAEKVISRAHDNVTEIITEAPGTAKSYLRSSTGIFLQWGTNLVEYTEEGTAVEVVFGDDNDIYLKNIMSYGATGTYVKGTIDGDKITVTLPQTVIYDEFAEDYVNLVMLEPKDVEGGQFTYGVNKESTSYTYTIKEDGSFEMDNIGWMNGIGYAFASNDTWAGYLDFNQTFIPFDNELVEGPEGMPLQSWACTTPTSAFPVVVAMDDSDFYVQGLCTYFPESWIRGRVEDDKVYIPNGQYLGLYDGIYHIYAMFGRTLPQGQELDPEDTEFVFNFDADHKSLTPTDEEMLIFFNTSWNRVYYLDYLECPVLTSQESYAGVPADPYDLVYDESNRPYYGYSAFRFYIPVVSTEGSVLDIDALYYNVFVDGELLEIDKDIYIDIEENMIDIPYKFTNYFDVWDRGYGLHQVGIYPANVQKLGVQSVYKYGDEVTKSKLIELTLQSSGIDNVEAVRTATTEMYDVMGRRVENPAEGSILIRRTVYSDGTVKTDKVIRK